MTNGKPVTIALLGAGARGELNFGTLTRRYPDKLRFVAVAEPHEARRERFIRNYGIEKKNAFRDWRDLLSRPKLAEAVINTLPCRMHFDSTMAAIDAGYDILLDKPMALTPGQCLVMKEAAEAKGLIFDISLQCRLNRIYTRMKQLMAERAIGQLMNIDCAENIGHWHFTMSYVRGIHHHSSLSHSFIMAKGIHDVDLIAWFAGAAGKKVSSFGSLQFFRKENAPEGAPERCIDSCPVESSCAFSAIKLFLNPGRPAIPLKLLTCQSLTAALDVIKQPRFRTMGSIVSPEDISDKGIKKALAETNFGRCVFHCPNDVVDHQTVSIEFENGVTASFSLSGFSLVWERTLNLHGAKGEIRSADFSGRLETRTYNPARLLKERFRYHGIIHGGSDILILLKFAEAVAEKNQDKLLTKARDALESHFLCFAAEKARLENRVVEMDEFRKEAKEEAKSISL